ncbi:MAG: hypothetical protein U0531_17740 [Dehalococcoidia bacterium]
MTAFDTSRASAHHRWLPRPARLPSIGVVASAALVAGAAMLPVVQASNTTTAGYETRRLAQQKLDLQAAIYNTQTEVAELGSLERIERDAIGRLGMVSAGRTGVITVATPRDTSWHVPARYLIEEPATGEEPAPVPFWQTVLDRLVAR